MTITQGEIIALTVVVAAVAAITVVICCRCWRALYSADKQQKAAEASRSLEHTPARGFYVSGYVDRLRRSLRRGSSRRDNNPPTKVVIPRVHVATVEDLIAERSDIHPVYLQCKDGTPRGQQQDTSPAQGGQGHYQRLQEEISGDGEVYGFENPMYGQPDQSPTLTDQDSRSNGQGSRTYYQGPGSESYDSKLADLSSRSNVQEARSGDQATKTSTEYSSQGPEPDMGSGKDGGAASGTEGGAAVSSEGVLLALYTPQGDVSLTTDSYM